MSIILNVSGKIFNVSRDVLCKSELFNGILSDCEISGEIIINRSAKLFEHVYAYLLDEKYPYPKKYYSELDYYLVPYYSNLLYDSNKKMKKEIKQLKKNQCIILQQMMILTLTRQSEFKRCMHKDCKMDPQDGDLLCWRHTGLCCYYDDEFCYNTIQQSQAYCAEHVLHYFEQFS